MKTKIQKKYVDNSLGFPVILINVPMINVRDWASPRILDMVLSA